MKKLKQPVRESLQLRGERKLYGQYQKKPESAPKSDAKEQGAGAPMK